jgi:hypothetical protein
MSVIEVVAFFILAAAILVLLYYYLLNNTEAVDRFKDYIPTDMPNIDEEERIPGEELDMSENIGDGSNVSMGEKLRVKFKDMDMSKIKNNVSNINSDAFSKSTETFSKRIDAFLDEKSEDLINEWSLATKDDVKDLEKRHALNSKDIDDLTQRFNDYKEYSNERLDIIEERLNKLEEE